MKIMEEAIFDLLQKESFYANFILNSQIRYNPKGLPTAAMAIINATPVLMFNTEWLAKHSRQEICSVLKHEILHILLDHTGRFGDQDKNLAQVANIAMDCAINQHIDPLPEGCVTLNSLAQITGNKNLMPYETYEYYYDALKSKIEELKASGQGTLDDHDYNVEGDEKNAAARQLAVKHAKEQALKASAGNVSESLAKLLGKLNEEAKLNWKQLLRNFIATSTSSQRIHTSKKVHRRLGLEHPGVKKKRLLTLGVCVDSSGSVSDESYMEFMAEIQAIAKNNTVYLVDADCEVKHVETVGPKTKLKPERHGGGGTAYQPAITECVRRKCTAIVYFGDMDTADTPTNPGIPVLWVTVGSETRPGEFGRMIKLV